MEESSEDIYLENLSLDIFSKVAATQIPATEGRDSVLSRLELSFSLQRTEFDRQIMMCVQDLRNLRTVVNVQVKMLSMRQRLLEDCHILYDKRIEQQKRFRERHGSLFNNVVNDLQVRLKSSADRESMIEADVPLSEIKYVIDLLDNQISYYSDSIKTVDQVLYGIKNRLDIQHLIGA